MVDVLGVSLPKILIGKVWDMSPKAVLCHIRTCTNHFSHLCNKSSAVY